MKKNEPVVKIMTQQLTTVQEGEPVSRVRKLFEQGDIHHVPVMRGEKLVGIVSTADLLRISFGEFGNQDGRELDTILDHTYRLDDVMNADPVTVSSHGTVRDAAKLLSTGNFHALPVVDGEKLVGIVTSTDLISYLADQ
ncbi:MAG: CBS domain-containing protein [Pirellulaceae bacterium]